MSNDIDALVFDDALIPETANQGPRDETPTTDSTLSCEVCGKSLVYGGRGRKPKFCPEHRRQTGKTPTVTRGGNEKLATQATESLIQINRLTGLGLRLIGLSSSSEMIMFCEEGFRVQAYEALLTDPALCKQILSAGAVSGKFSLAIAYAMMGAQVAPVAMMEIKQKRADKQEAEEGTE